MTLLMRDQENLEKGIQKGIEKGMQKGLQEGIRKTVDALRDFRIKDSEIKATIIKKYGLSEEKAEKYL